MSIFSDKGLSFRLVESQDLPLIASMRNDQSTWSQLGDPRPLKTGLQQGWLEGVNKRQDCNYFIVEDQEKNIPIGLVRMDEIDLQNRSVRVGADVSVGMRGRGYGFRIYCALKQYLFNELGMHRVWLCVLATNEAGIKVYKKAGFKQEGRYRKAVWRGGRWVDYLVMSILSEEHHVGA